MTRGYLPCGARDIVLSARTSGQPRIADPVLVLSWKNCVRLSPRDGRETDRPRASVLRTRAPRFGPSSLFRGGPPIISCFHGELLGQGALPLEKAR